MQQITPFYRKTSLEGLNLVSKMGCNKMEHEFSFGIFRPEKKEYTFQTLCYSRKSGVSYFTTGVFVNFSIQELEKNMVFIQLLIYETLVIPFKFEKECL